MEEVSIGSLLEGRYEIVEHVGRGRLGEVFRAVDAESGESRLVKLLSPELAQNQGAVDRFHQDLRAAAGIRHPQVATLHDYSLLPDGSLYLAWEWVEGDSLETLIDREGALPLERALYLGLQISDGLAAIHREGLAHRDLTPGNVLSPGGAVKIVDLGLSRSLRDSSEGSNQSVDAMLHYCSPEHVGLVPGVLPDAKSDQFAFAVMAYQMISGRLPFKGVSTAGSLEARFVKPPRPLVSREVGVSVDPRLLAALSRAMSFDREARFERIEDLARELRHVYDDLQPAARVPEASEAETVVPVAHEALDPLPATLPASEEPEPVPATEPAAVEPPALPDAEELMAAAERAMARAEFGKALQRISDIRDSGAMTPEIGSLELRAQMALRQQRHSQALEARQMLEAYLAQRQDKLAALALEALLEVAPEVEGRQELEGRVASLQREVQQERQIQELLDRGFERLHGGDLDGALAALLEVEGRAPAAAARLRTSIERHQIEVSQEERIEKLKRRAEELLSRRRLGEVEEVLDSLAALGVPQLVTDVYRHRIEALREERAIGATAEEIEIRFRKELAHHQWAEARHLADDLERLLGSRERAARLREEVVSAEGRWRREQAVEEGVDRLKSYIALGHVQEAEVALAIVQKLAPNHPQRVEFERQVQILRNSAHG